MIDYKQKNNTIILASDLDNTLIYSYKHDIGNCKIPVEWKDGKILSYMTEYAYYALNQVIHEVLFVPVSTRSVEQYQRIQLLKQGEPKYAIVSNGGTLLVEGKEDKDWAEETKKLIQKAMPTLEKVITFLIMDQDRSLEVRLVDESFVFTKSKNPEGTLQRLKEQFVDSTVEFYHNGEKIYAVPAILNKGNAVCRLLKRIGISNQNKLYAAGDSEFDLPMLEIADMAFCPKVISNQMQNQKQKKRCSDGSTILSDVIFQALLKKDFNSHKI